MTLPIVLPAITSVLALLFSAALFDQWRERRHGFQLIWGLGMLFFGIASGAEALAGILGWNETLYKAWYLTGATWTAGWLGLGTAFLLGRTRFGYTFAVSLLFAGIITLLTQRRYDYPDAGTAPIIYLIAALILALAVAVETYFQNERWPALAASAVIGATVLSAILMATVTLAPPGYALNTVTGMPVGDLFPGTIRLLTPFLNVTGALSLLLGAVFSTYVFMPKKRVLPYSLDADQPGDQFLFNLLIAPVAISVNFVASLPGTIRGIATGTIHSRVPATILIAIGAFIPTVTDSMNRLGSTELFQLGKFLGVVFLFAGFLVSIEVFREIRVPFTSIRLSGLRRERAPAAQVANATEPTPSPSEGAGVA